MQPRGGAVANTLVGVILPAMFHLKLRAHEMTAVERGFNTVVLVFGVVGGGCGRGSDRV